MSTSAPTVVGVDGSSTALDAVRWAAHDAALHHSELVLVSSICPPANAMLPTSYYEALQADADRALIEACQQTSQGAGKRQAQQGEPNTLCRHCAGQSSQMPTVAVTERALESAIP